jgi:ribose-phosphate pyrophosphokinase
LEICGQDVLTQGLASLGIDPTSAAPHGLTRSQATTAPRSRSSEKIRVRKTSKVCEVIGQVAGKHVIIYDDMTGTGGTLIHAAKKYIDEGAVIVDVLLGKRLQLWREISGPDSQNMRHRGGPSPIR